MNQSFYQCPICGKTAVLFGGGDGLACCGHSMVKMNPQNGSPAGKTHIPICQRERNHVTVLVGAEDHSMEESHRIEWICLETNLGAQYRFLHAGDVPGAGFSLTSEESPIRALSYCGNHGLWESDGIRIT